MPERVVLRHQLQRLRQHLARARLVYGFVERGDVLRLEVCPQAELHPSDRPPPATERQRTASGLSQPLFYLPDSFERLPVDHTPASPFQGIITSGGWDRCNFEIVLHTNA